jgi:hypothetical protein
MDFVKENLQEKGKEMLAFLTRVSLMIEERDELKRIIEEQREQIAELRREVACKNWSAGSRR